MHTTTMTDADRSALENLWDKAGTWCADTWTRLNADHFTGQLMYRGIVFGLTPHGHRLGHTYENGRITLHPSLLDPRGDAWRRGSKLGDRYAEDVLLHEMVHAWLFQHGGTGCEDGGHNTDEWCAEIVRITPGLSLPPIKAAPVKTRRINGKVMRKALDGYLARADIAAWPHSIRPADWYDREGRMEVQI